VTTTANIPALETLKPGKCWVNHNKDKEPFNSRTGYPAKADDPSTWSTYQQAMSALRQHPDEYTGIGRELVKEEGYVAFDFDHCLDEQGHVSPFVQDKIARLNSYTEITPSGKGLRIWVRGNLPDNINTDIKADGPNRIEAYDSKRYMTVTGNHFSVTPITIEERQEVIEAIYYETLGRRAAAKKKAAPSSPKQTYTPNGNISAYGRKALDDEYRILATTQEGGRDTQLFKSAATLGELIGGEVLAESEVEGALYSACVSNGLLGDYTEAKVRDTISRGIAKGRQNPRTPPARDYPEYKAEPRAEGLGNGHAINQEQGTQNGVEDGQQTTSTHEKEESQALKLVKMALDRAELFSTPEGSFFARVRVNEHIETMSINERGGSFKRWLINLYLAETGSISNATALSSAIEVLEAKAQFGGATKREVHVRLAYHDGNIYLDLANAEHEVIEVSPAGWTIKKKDVPVCFRRPEGMLPLPTPVHGGSLDELRQFIHIDNDDEWLLLKAFALGMCHPTGPYVILNLNGERGSTKSSAARFLRSLIDPNKAPLRKEPKDDQTFSVMAHNNYVVALDNLSHISSRLSDLMCTLSTGAGDAYRKHYTNDEEMIFSTRRPQIFTGIEDLATRGDLIDRCITIKLTALDETQRRDERTLEHAFKEAHPRMLGALLDAVSLALCNLPQVKAMKLPRMADFAIWVIAAEQMLTTDTPGSFLRAYNSNRAEGIATEIEASAVGNAILKLMQTDQRWESSATDLLKKLKTLVDEDLTKQKSWPKSPRALSGILKRLATSLRAKKILVVLGRNENGSCITITTIHPDANPDAKSENFASGTSDFASGTSDFASGTSDFASATNETIGDFTPILTQNDAKYTTSLLDSEEEKRGNKREDGQIGVHRNDTENLRHFASGDWVSLPDGQTGCVTRVSELSCDVQVYGTIRRYTASQFPFFKKVQAAS
jgi:hypothetical protein